MANGTTAFPAFIRAEYDPSGSGFRDFESAFSQSARKAEQQFTQAFDQIGAKLAQSLNRGVGANGKLDLGTAEMRQATAEAKFAEQAYSDLLRTATLLARETGDTSSATRNYIAALSAQRIEASQIVRENESQLATYTRLQAALDVTADKNSRLAQSYRETYAEAARAAQLEVANSRFGASIAPSLGSSALSNGAGYRELEQAARAADAYERQLAELRQQVDPLAFEQARVNKEMVFAAEAYRRGDISADQLAARNQQLNASLTQMRGGFRETRQGMIQVGQQMQDVAISLIGGQRAGTVLAQQLPQLAFAASNFGGKIGAVATVLSGPYSLALVGASFLLGAFIDNMLGADDASKKAAKSTYDFTAVLDTRLLSIKKFSDAIDQLNESTRGLIDTQALLADSSLASAAGAAADAQRRLADIDRQLKELGPAPSGPLSIIPGFGELGSTTARRDSLLAQRKALAETLSSAEQARAQAEIAIAQRRIDESIDRAAGIKGEFDRQIAELRQRRLESAKFDASDPLTSAQRQNLGDRYLSQSEFERRYAELRRNQDKALEAQKAAERTQRSKALPPVTLREVTQIIAGQLGGQITSTTGGKHVKGSYHYSGQAVDFVPRGGMGALSKEDIRAAFGAAGIQIKELLGPGDKDHDDHFHVAFAKRRQSVEQVQDALRRMEDASRRAAEKMQRDIDSAAESVSQLRGQFDRAPRDIDRAAAAVIDLNQAIDEADKKLKAGGLTDAQRGVVEETKRRAQETRDQIIPEFLTRPITESIAETRDLIDAQNLLIQGRTAEYDRIQDSIELARLLGAESLDQLETQIEQRGIARDMVEAYYEQQRILRQQSVELQHQQEQQQILLGIVEDVSSATKSAIYDLFDGKGIKAARNFFNDIYDITKRQMTEEIYEALFGDLFRQQKLKILGLDQVDETGKAMAQAIRVTIDPIRDLGNAAAAAARQIRGSVAANDNESVDKIVKGLTSSNKMGAKSIGGTDIFSEDIVVNAFRSNENIGSELKKLNKTAADGLGKNGSLPKSLSGIGESVSGALRGAAVGEMTSGLLKSLGIKQSKLGAQIGGAAGSFLPIPGGEIIGSIIGGTIGGLFKKTPRGFATIGGEGSNLRITGTGGNSKNAREAGIGAAGATMDTLAQIAEALGGTYDASRGSVSIGRSGDSWHVDTSGRGRLKKSQGGFDFDDDYEAAVRFATMDLIKDGVIAGLRASTQRLLQQGKDIDAALQKALDFESVFTRLKEYDDPVGAALDTLDKEFSRLKTIFAEAGASAAEYAELERLYGIERADAIKEAAERLTSGLQSLYDDLTIGDNGRSLRDRLAAAQSAYDPLKQRVLAGDKTAYDDFAEAARSLLDIRREFSGSQTPYFNLLDEITAITKERIEAEKNVVALAESRDSPFGSNGKATGANDNAAVVGAIDRQTEVLTAGFRALLTASGGFSGGGGFSTNPFL